MNKQQGFTLIELVIVIIVLGILAATAIPKFINLSSDARIASLKGMEGAMRSGTNLIYSKAVITNQDDGDKPSANIDGLVIQLHSGYPVGNWINGIRYIVNLDTVYFSSSTAVCDADWCGRGNQKKLKSENAKTTGRLGKIYPRGYSWNDECGVYYVNHEDGRPAEIGLETEDCK